MIKLHVPFVGALALAIAAPAEADVIQWIDVVEVPESLNVVISDPALGDIEIMTTFSAQATFTGQSGGLGSLTWASFDYINYDASSSGTNAPISASMTFNFLDGPIDTSLTPVYFSSNGLAEDSSYTVNGDPQYLGDIGVADGSGTRTPLGGGVLRISGAGDNHNPDLYRFNEPSISAITVGASQVLGDGAGFTIGAVAPPTKPTCPGDFNKDGVVDGADFGIFGAAFGSSSGDANYNPDADFDASGTVDGADFGVFGSEFGRTDC